MAIVVETGAGVPNAVSYLSEAEADAYFAARGIDAWDNVDNKEAALIKATDYIEANYGEAWRGYRRTNTQALSWPRMDVPVVDQSAGWPAYYDYTTIPSQIKKATAELALIAASSDLMPNLDRGQSSVSIGPISVTYDSSSPESPRYPMIDAILAPLITVRGPMVSLVRT